MTAPKPSSTDNDDPIMANPEAVAEIALRAFGRAKDQAIEENERLGVSSHGTRIMRHQVTIEATTADFHHE